MGHLCLAKISRKKCLAKFSLRSDIVKNNFILKEAHSLMVADNYLRPQENSMTLPTGEIRYCI